MFNIDREEIFEKIKQLPPNIVVIEISWDGDDYGWCLCLSAIEKISENTYEEHRLAPIGHGQGELYDFNRLVKGEVPPYPESVIAQQIGQEIADQLGIPLYFPSPQKPVLSEVPRWVDWREGRVSSVPIRLINIEKIIERFSNQKVVVIEAYWSYFCTFYPKMAIITLDEQSNYKKHEIGELYWDEADRGRIIYGRQIPPNTPTEEAIRLGNLLAQKLGVPFHFDSPHQPAHRIPRWIQRQQENRN